MKHNITLGILGGGQLGRMSAMSAARLGISVVIFCSDKNSPASHVANEVFVAEYDDKAALKRFSDICDFITYEFENIPIETVEYLEGLKPRSVLPEKSLLLVSQDRVKEKLFLNNIGIKTTRWKEISNINDIADTIGEWSSAGFILKTTRFGYDGKGQIKCCSKDIANNKELTHFLEQTKTQPLIMEDLVDFKCEISVIIARDYTGKTETYGAMLNEHKNHILHKTTVPCDLSKSIQDSARDIAEKIANAVNLTGVLTVEFFVTNKGDILVNEIAPRTHNSGHWSIDACAVSQFENHVRSVCALPVGSSVRHSDAQMLNLIGDDVDGVISDGEKHMSNPNTCVHLYGKTDIRKGRKMGHITFLKQKENYDEQ